MLRFSGAALDDDINLRHEMCSQQASGFHSLLGQQSTNFISLLELQALDFHGLLGQQSTDFYDSLKRQAADFHGLVEQQAADFNGLLGQQQTPDFQGLLGQQSADFYGSLKQQASDFHGLLERQASDFHGLLEQKSSEFHDLLGQEISGCHSVQGQHASGFHSLLEQHSADFHSLLKQQASDFHGLLGQQSADFYARTDRHAIELATLGALCQELQKKVATWAALGEEILFERVLHKHKHKHGILDKQPVAPRVSSLANLQELIALGDWARQMDIDVADLYRKNWEWVYIAQALHERGLLAPGKRGVGFAVGTEPLVALFAKHGIQVTATDLPESKLQANNLSWKSGKQHSAHLSALEYTKVCDRKTFYRNARFLPVDMTDIPDSLGGFDFCWSSCALEHLGGVQKGKDFILNALKVLKPGGIAIHTTEYNLSGDGNGETIYGIVFGSRFFEELRDEITAMGHDFAPLDFRLGTHPLDDHIIKADEERHHHFKLLLGDYIATSIGIIIQVK
jgi:SAM-dependent methyltransferase